MITVIFELPPSVMKSSDCSFFPRLIKLSPVFFKTAQMEEARSGFQHKFQRQTKHHPVITADLIDGSGARPVHKRISVIIVSQML